MKIDKSRRIMFFVSLIGIVVVTLIMGTTFAYQTLVVNYKEGSDNDTVVEAGKLNVSYENNNKIDLKNMTLLPNYKTADYTEFTIKTNDTSYDVAYQINLKNLEYSNGMISDSFMYTITLVEENNEFIIGEGDFASLIGNEINLPFNMNTYRILEKGKDETLRLYLWLKENENTQELENSSFKGYIEIVSLFSNETDEIVYKTFKIYGNSVQNGEPTIDNPIEIKSLGTFDETTGKYKIPVKVSGKNLLDYNTFTSRNQNSFPLTFNNDGSLEYTGNYYIQTDGSFLESGKTYIFNMKYESDITPFWRIKYTDGTYSGQIQINQSYTIDIAKTVESVLLYVEMTNNTHTIKCWDIQLEEGTNSSNYEPYVKPMTVNILLKEPLRKVGNYADYIDFKNGKVVRNVKVNDSTGTLTIDNSYSALEVPVYKKLDSYNIPYIKDGNISVCTTDLCASNIEIELNK